jgi:hypothetical protein
MLVSAQYFLGLECRCLYCCGLIKMEELTQLSTFKNWPGPHATFVLQGDWRYAIERVWIKLTTCTCGSPNITQNQSE